MSSIEYIYEQNLCDSDAQIIAHQCCCVCGVKKDKGLYFEIAEKFPYADCYETRTEDSTPGTVKLFGNKKLKQRLVLSIFAQLKPGPPTKKDSAGMRERWFTNALKKISNIKGIKSIAFPYKIGCGLAQGNWEIYKNKIEEWAKNNPSIDVYIISRDRNSELSYSAEHHSQNEYSDEELLEDETDEELEEKIAPKAIEEIGNVEELDDSFDSEDDCTSTNTYSIRGTVNINSTTKKELSSSLTQLPKINIDDFSNDHEFLKWFWEYMQTLPFINPAYFINLYEKKENIKDLSPSYEWKTTTLLEYTDKNIPPTYEVFFKNMIDGGYIEELSNFLQKESKLYDIYPNLENIYKAFDLCSLDNLKVLIVGQDPYATKDAAIGVAFGHSPNTRLQPSLRNIYKAIEKDGFQIKTDSGDISKWCKQGVFLINTALTVRAGNAGSHTSKTKDGPWEYFTRSLFKFIDEKKDHIVVMLWGAVAQKYKDLFSIKKHFIITSAHPAASAYNPSNTEFIDSLCFSKANRKLKVWGNTPIDWSLE